MKTSTLINGKIPLLLAFACAALTGCFSDSGTNSNGNNSASASITGTIQGDAETSSSSSSSDTGWQATMVTAFAINADGSLGAAQDSAMASANGTFTIQTQARGHQEWILRARRGANEWMARFEDTLQDNQTEHSRPLNLESTLEAAVYLQLKNSAEGREVRSSEVNLAIDASVAASGSSEYRGTSEQRSQLVARLAASVNAASRARNAFLAASDSLYASRKSWIDTTRARAEASFNASLYAAGSDTSAARNAQRAYLNAVVNAYVNADIQRTEYARSTEASYQAALRASAQISDSTRARMARNYVRIMVIASDTAMLHEFRQAGSSSARVNLVAVAGGRFQSSVDTARSRASLDSAVARFRTEVRTAFRDSTGADTAGFHLFGVISSTLNMNNLYASLTASLHAALTGSSTDGQDVGQAYSTAQASAETQLQTAIFAQNNDNGKAAAAANLIAFLNVYSSSN